MAKFEDHCAESIRLFGKPYEEVHSWLDAFAGTKVYGYRHRKKWHHGAGSRPEDGLTGYTSTTVSVRRGGSMYTSNEKGRQVSVMSAR